MSESQLTSFLQNNLLINILQNSADLGKCTASITTQIREIIGAKIVAIYIKNIDDSLEVVGVCPERRRDDLKEKGLEQLLKNFSSRDRSKKLTVLDESVSIFILPLELKDERLGFLVLYDIMDMKGTDQILKGLDSIATLLSVIIYNSHLYRNMKALVDKRTKQLKTSEEKFKNIFENIHTSIWEEDFSEVVTKLNNLKENGVTDLRSYLDSNNDVFYELLSTVKVVHVNKATLELFEVTDENYFLSNISNSFGDGAMDVFKDELLSIWDNKKEFRREALFKKFSGETFNGIVSFTAPDTISGYSCLPVSIVDISYRKKHENHLLKIQQRLNSAQKLAKIGTWELDLVCNKLEWTDEIFRIFETSPQSFPDTYEAFLDFVHPEDRDLVNNTYLNSLKTGSDYSIQHRILLSSGKIKHVTENFKNYYDKLGNPIKSIGTVQDITDRVKAEKERINLEEQLLQGRKMEAIGQLTGGIAHDFNNMLGGIMGSAQLLQSPNRNLDDKSRKYVNLILDSAQNAASLVKKLLGFSRKNRLNEEVIDISQIIDESINILNRVIDKKVSIKVDDRLDESNIVGDSSAFQNVIINLVINASQAMPGGGVVELVMYNKSYKKSDLLEIGSPINEGHYIVTEVKDNGTGIDEDILDKVFEPFFTTKEQGKGTGLGLSVVFNTIDKFGGKIKVESVVNKGTIFTIYLPTSKKEIISKTEEVTSEKGYGCILIADDEQILREVSKDYFEDLGYKVILAENGKQAVDIYKERVKEIDLVILDMIMPVMNGKEAFYKLKEINENSKVIIASGFTNYEDMTALKSKGLSGYIKKPYTISEISQLSDQIINNDP